MAVTLTVDQLAEALRVGDSAEETAQLTRLLAVARAMIQKLGPSAPSDVQNEAAVRYAGYLYDQPNAGRGMSYASALQSSGAMSLLIPWKQHGAALISDVELEEAAAAAAANPVTAIVVDQAGAIIVTYQDETTATLDTPAGVDQEARAAIANLGSSLVPTPTADDVGKRLAATFAAGEGGYELVDPAGEQQPAGGGLTRLTQLGSSASANVGGGGFDFNSTTALAFLRSWLGLSGATQYEVYRIEVTWSDARGGQHIVGHDFRRRPADLVTQTDYYIHFPFVDLDSVDELALSFNRSNAGRLNLRSSGAIVETGASAAIFGVS